MKKPKIQKMKEFINSWNFIFALLVGITGLFTLSGFHDLVFLDKELSKKIVIILIPITAGGIVTKFTTNSWQITKEKILIKQNILSDYEKSYKLLPNLTDNFVNKIVESYIIYKSSPPNTTSTLDLTKKPTSEEINADKVKRSPKADIDTVLFESYTKPELAIFAYLKFPDAEHSPLIRFGAEYNIFGQKLEKASITQNKFLSDIRLYYEDDLKDQIDKIQDILNDKTDIAQRLLSSKNPGELKEFFQRYEKTTQDAIKAIRELELKLVSLKFRKFSL